jgi:lambda family phage portal protein
MADDKPRYRVPARTSTVDGGLVAPSRRSAFDAGKSERRLKGVPTATAAINSQIRRYGRTVLARSRYLAANNPYAAAAKATYVSALVGSGIKPSWLVKDAALKAKLQELWLDWTDETDADGLTDFYGQQGIIGGEMFEAGECFVRFRPRRADDGFAVPLQLQILPAEMLPINDNRTLTGGNEIECGIEFDKIGRRVAYWFLRNHPGSDIRRGNAGASDRVRVPASEVLHLYKPFSAGQVRGIPHTLSAIAKLAMLDQYDDAELERKKIAALFAAFITRPRPEDDNGGPLGGQKADATTDGVDNGVALEPGSISELAEGESIEFAEPADVGNNYEQFQYRTLLSCAAGFGVPYAAMTGDLRSTSYGSMRGGLIEFRRRIEGDQHHVMVFQFCRPVKDRFLRVAALEGDLDVGGPSAFLGRERELRRVKWIPPHWDWIDPWKDMQAEKLAVRAGFKSRGDVIEQSGYDPEETDARIAADKKRADRYDLVFDSDAAFTSNAGVTNARPDGTAFVPEDEVDDDEDDDANPKPPKPEEDPENAA